MGTFEKFLFDTSFDSEQVREARARAAAELVIKSSFAAYWILPITAKALKSFTPKML